MTGHLSPPIMNALVDGELSADQLASASEHLAGCASCTSVALDQSLLKAAAAKAGQRYAPPPQMQERLARGLAQEASGSQASPSRTSSRSAGFAYYGWATACALVLVFASMFFIQRNTHRTAIVASETGGLVTEISDQHIATLASTSPPQVLSSDRHTVKPWFQGKIPFSFNLPDSLPGDTTLDGANLTYIRNQPAAQLLYRIGRHRVSVFVRAGTGGIVSNELGAEHSGFHVAGFNTGDLDVVAVSDVDPTRLSDLVSRIERAQTGTMKQPR